MIEFTRRRNGAGEMEDQVGPCLGDQFSCARWIGDVACVPAHVLQMLPPRRPRDRVHFAGPARHEQRAQVRSNKSRAAGDQDAQTVEGGHERLED
jgi:hypothetical protein